MSRPGLWQHLRSRLPPARNVSFFWTMFGIPSLASFSVVSSVLLALVALALQPVGIGEQFLRFMHRALDPPANVPVVLVEFDDHTATRYPEWMQRPGLLCTLERIGSLKPRAMMLDVYFGKQQQTFAPPSECSATTVPEGVPVIAAVQTVRSGGTYELVEPDPAVGAILYGHVMVDRPTATAPVPHLNLWLDRGGGLYQDYVPSIALLTAWSVSDAAKASDASLSVALAACLQNGVCPPPLDALPPRPELSLDDQALTQGITRISAADFVRLPGVVRKAVFGPRVQDAIVIIGYTANSTGDLFRVGNDLLGDDVPGVLLHAAALRQILEGQLHAPADWKVNSAAAVIAVALTWLLAARLRCVFLRRFGARGFVAPVAITCAYVMVMAVFLSVALGILARHQTLMAVTLIGTVLTIWACILIVFHHLDRQLTARNHGVAFRRHCGSFYDADPEFWHALLDGPPLEAQVLRFGLRPDALPDTPGLSIFQRRVLGLARDVERDAAPDRRVRVFITTWHENRMAVYIVGDEAPAIAASLNALIQTTVTSHYSTLLRAEPPEATWVQFSDMDSPTEDDLIAVFHCPGAVT